ncbi:helix-turn-helix domain protein [Coriobacterium glomerans PW2]|uniref:Helix-turn-helix domain protein n=1 Tax=Coriobacterium glomerans (strain ATCC 49209 / DSM 20642 / JCM 10262 / PW2) TaxID=700015 RepID=F2N8A1_CORGP|nr:helix-turn-helix transcriptional regulator [Coriobacterium glomerans]AEB07284.1 helix-turn-helix domain protein [Coriobacterium glomerans PW2]
MSDSVDQQIGARIRCLRKKRTGLSQNGFACQIGIDRSYFATIEQGKHSATLQMLARISQGLGVSLQELFEGL